jgi:hypothetical protein
MRMQADAIIICLLLFLRKLIQSGQSVGSDLVLCDKKGRESGRETWGE